MSNRVFCLAASNVWFYQVDITSSASLREVAQKIRSEHGDPTILVNNAGVMHLATILDESEEQVRRIFEVNIIAHFLLMKEFLPSMIEHNHGHIITLASLASFVTGVKNVDYSCTKAGALAFHEGLTQELKHSYNARKVRTRSVLVCGHVGKWFISLANLPYCLVSSTRPTSGLL